MVCLRGLSRSHFLRAAPTTPSKPVPSSRKVVGSGVVGGGPDAVVVTVQNPGLSMLKEKHCWKNVGLQPNSKAKVSPSKDKGTSPATVEKPKPVNDCVASMSQTEAIS